MPFVLDRLDQGGDRGPGIGTDGAERRGSRLVGSPVAEIFQDPNKRWNCVACFGTDHGQSLGYRATDPAVVAPQEWDEFWNRFRGLTVDPPLGFNDLYQGFLGLAVIVILFEPLRTKARLYLLAHYAQRRHRRLGVWSESAQGRGCLERHLFVLQRFDQCWDCTLSDWAHFAKRIRRPGILVLQGLNQRRNRRPGIRAELPEYLSRVMTPTGIIVFQCSDEERNDMLRLRLHFPQCIGRVRPDPLFGVFQCLPQYRNS